MERDAWIFGVVVSIQNNGFTVRAVKGSFRNADHTQFFCADDLRRYIQHVFFKLDLQVGFFSLNGDLYLRVSLAYKVIFFPIKCRSIFQIGIVIDVGRLFYLFKHFQVLITHGGNGFHIFLQSGGGAVVAFGSA